MKPQFVNRSDANLPCFLIGKLQEKKIEEVMKRFCVVDNTLFPQPIKKAPEEPVIKQPPPAISILPQAPTILNESQITVEAQSVSRMQDFESD